MVADRASAAKYWRHLEAKGPANGRASQPGLHWRRLARLRQFRPQRLDQLHELGAELLDAHDGDIEAVLGSLVVHLDARVGGWPRST